MTRFEAPAALPHACLSAVKICCICKKPLPCHCRSEMDRQIENEILDWIKEIPVYSDDTKDNRYLRCMLSKKLVETLQKMIKDGDFGKIREEIDNCLNVLPMWCPENDKDKITFKNQMAENLMNRLKQFMVKDFFKEQIILWFNELPFKDQIKPEDRENIIDRLVNNLKAVERVSNDDDYKEALKNEIVKILNEIPGIDKDVIMSMANKFTNSLVHAETKEKSLDNELRKNICEWIDNTSEFTENTFYVKENVALVDELTRTLTEQQKKSTDCEKVKEQMRKDIMNWLQNAFKSKNVFLDISTKSKLAQKLIDKMYPSQIKTPVDPYITSIFDWLKDTPELAHCLNENNLVENLAKKLKDLQQGGYDDDALLQVIEDWINQLCEKHGIHIDPKVVKQLAQKLLDKLRLQTQIPRKPRKLAKHFQETISNEISRILENDALPLSSKVKKNLQNKITNILSNNIENVLSNETTTAKKDIIKLLEHEGNMTTEEAKDLANTVINSAKTMPLTEDHKKSPTKSLLYQSKKSADRIIKREYDESEETDEEYRRDVDETVSNLLPDEMIRGTKTDTMRDNINNFLYEPRPDTVSDDATPKLVKRKREMSLQSTSLDSNKIISQQLRNVEKTVFDFIDDVLVNHSPNTKDNIRTSAKNFIDNVLQFIQKKDKESVLKEVQSFLNSVPISSDITRKELVDELTNRLVSDGFQASTPRKGFSFLPKRLTFDSSLPSIHLGEEFYGTTSGIIEEDKYREDLTDVVKKWLAIMPLSLNKNDSTRFKDVVINDLVGDIVDRQKYLQLNPGAKASDIEELENLKYQVFRWLNKVMDTRDFDIVMPQTGTLMDSIRRVEVPQLVTISGGRKDVKKSRGQLPNYQDALQDEISMWVADIPKHLRQSTDKKIHNKMVEELAKRLQHAESENADSEIKNWLQKFFRFPDDDIKKAAQDLNKKLARKGLSKDISWLLEEDSNEFIQENLQGGILDWLKEFPQYQSANIQDRNTQERIIEEMAKGIKNVFETALTTSQDMNTNELFMDEIIKHLKKFPIDLKKKSDPNFLRHTAANLLQHLKGLKMFQNISDRDTTTPDLYLNTSVDDWINSLPIVDKQSLLLDKNFKTLTKEFKQNLIELKERGDEKGLREEIKNKLKMLPIDPMKLNDDKFINKNVDQLLKNIQTSLPKRVTDSQYENILIDIDSSFGPRHGARRLSDVLSEPVNIFCDVLLIEKSKLSGGTENVDVIKQNIAKKLMHRIEELNMNPDVTNDDFLYKGILEDELDNVISVLRPSEVTDRTLNELKKNLINKVMEARDAARSELAGQIYKQQLRDTISKTLPPAEGLSADEQISFEVVKDNLADAFINLHFYGGSVEERKKYKNKINQEISKFCDDYLLKYPSTPIDPDKLNKELYAKLNKVSFPMEDSIRDEVEETKIKDLITDYVNELPLRQDTPAEELQVYKVKSLMAKRLHELERDKDSLDNYEENLKNEIIKWTKKLPLEHWREDDIIKLADKLADGLKMTEASRRFDSTMMDTVNFDRTKYSASRELSRPSRMIDSVTPRLPPSTLSSQDREHLQRIRERSMSGRPLRTSPVRKDAAISPAPIDAESQTEIRPWEDNSAIQRCPSFQAATQVDQASEPHVCQSPTCGLRKLRPCVQSERPCGPISPETCMTKINWPGQDQRERLLPCDIIMPESSPRDLQSSSCECQPMFIPYNFSPRQDSAKPRPFMSPPNHAPNIFRHFRSLSPEHAPATPKRPKRRDHSPPRREERPRKTIRPRLMGLGAWEPSPGISKGPEIHDETYGLRHHYGAPLYGTSSRREVLISDDEFEDRSTEEKFKCGCKERGSSNNYARNRGGSCKGECMKRCPKCCGVHCPHPTHLYFSK